MLILSICCFAKSRKWRYHLPVGWCNIQREIRACRKLLARLPTKSGRKKNDSPADIDNRRLRYNLPAWKMNSRSREERKKREEKCRRGDHRARLNARLKLKFQSSRAFIGCSEKKNYHFSVLSLSLVLSFLASLPLFYRRRFINLDVAFGPFFVLMQRSWRCNIVTRCWWSIRHRINWSH